MSTTAPVRAALLALGAAWGLSAELTAQSPLPLAVPAGHASHTLFVQAPWPFDLHGFAFDERAGDLYLATGDRVVKRDAQAQETLVRQLGTGDAADLLAAPAGTGLVVYQSRNTGTLYLRDLKTGSTRNVPGLRNAYDVAATATGQLLAVANPTWPAPGAQSGVYLLDTTAGRHREVIRLAGPSGPLAFTPGGDLVYAVQSDTFPTPRGAVRLVRFTAAQLRAALAATTPMPLSAGQVALAGLDGAADLAFDDRGRLWITDPQRGGLLRTQPGSFVLEAVAFVGTGPLATTWLQFVDTGPATLDPYQPSAGGAMFCGTTDWSTSAEVRRIEARRPELASSVDPVPPGPLRLTIAAAPGRAAVLLGVTVLPPVPSRAVFFAGGLPVWMSLDFLVPPLVLQTTADAAGAAAWPLVNPGGAALTLHLQALVATPAITATSNLLTLTIR